MHTRTCFIRKNLLPACSRFFGRMLCDIPFLPAFHLHVTFLFFRKVNYNETCRMQYLPPAVPTWLEGSDIGQRNKRLTVLQKRFGRLSPALSVQLIALAGDLRVFSESQWVGRTRSPICSSSISRSCRTRVYMRIGKRLQETLYCNTNFNNRCYNYYM